MKTTFFAYRCASLVMWIGLCLMTPAAAAAGDSNVDISARMGFDVFSETEYFHLYEIDGRVGFSPYMAWGDGWSLGPALVFSCSILNAAGKDGIMVGIGPRIELTFPWDRLTAYATVRPSAMSAHQYGNVDLGGWFAFATDVGIRINLDDNLMLGYAYEHISNANIYDNNPGVNFHVIELSLKF